MTRFDMWLVSFAVMLVVVGITMPFIWVNQRFEYMEVQARICLQKHRGEDLCRCFQAVALMDTRHRGIQSTKEEVCR
jgi:hypothetical protein